MTSRVRVSVDATRIFQARLRQRQASPRILLGVEFGTGLGRAALVRDGARSIRTCNRPCSPVRGQRLSDKFRTALWAVAPSGSHSKSGGTLRLGRGSRPRMAADGSSPGRPTSMPADEAADALERRTGIGENRRWRGFHASASWMVWASSVRWLMHPPDMNALRTPTLLGEPRSTLTAPHQAEGLPGGGRRPTNVRPEDSNHELFPPQNTWNR